MAREVPSTQQEWAELAKQLATESATDHPGVDPAGWEEFKKAAMGRSGPTWIIQAILPGLIGLMLVTQYVLKIVEWGGIGWLLALVVAVVGAGFANVRIVSASRKAAIELGKKNGYFVQ